MKNHKQYIFSGVIFLLLAASHQYCYSQKIWSEQSRYLTQLRESKADTQRVTIYLKFADYYLRREYYLYRSGKPNTQIDSARWFAGEAFKLSKALKYRKGQNAALLIEGNALIRKNDMRSAINLLRNLDITDHYQLLISVSRHYLFHTNRTTKDLDSAHYFIQKASRLSSAGKTSRSKFDEIHVEAMRTFIDKGWQQSAVIYQQLINEVTEPGTAEKKALLWHELSTLIPLRQKKGLTRLNCFEKMLALYRQCNNQEREAWVLKTIADVHLVNSEPGLAEAYYTKSLAVYKAIGYRDLHYIYELLAVACRNKGEFQKCNFYGIKAIESMKASNDSVSSLTFYKRLANLYKQSGQPDKSREWFLKTFNNPLFKEGNNIYQFWDAGLFVRELIKINRKKEALDYILDVEKKVKPNDLHAQASLISSLAYCYKALQEQRMADKYYGELINLSGKLQNDNGLTSDIYSEIGQYFIDKKLYQKALVYLQKALKSAEGADKMSQTKDIYKKLYKADYKQGNYSAAIRHLMMNKLLNDSLLNETKNWQSEELRVQFETDKKNKDIKILNSQNQLQTIRAEEATRMKNITLGGIFLLLVITGLLINQYLIKRKSNQQLEISRKELDQKNYFLETLNIDQEKLLDEKEWLIKEVNHRVKNNLQMVTSLLYSQSIYLQDEVAKIAIADSLRRMQAMSIIHMKLYQYDNTSKITMPEYVSELVKYLHDSFDSGNRIKYDLSVAPVELDVAQAIPLGLIITESIVNAIKHAFTNGENGLISTSLQRDGEDLSLEISDNGIGLPEGLDTSRPESLGLDLMQGLTKQLKGKFHIVNNNGVHISVKFSA